MDLKDHYRLAQRDVHAGAALALIGLTGLSLKQSQHAELHLDDAYAQVDNAIYPLSEQAIDLLQPMDSGAVVDIRAGLRVLKTNVEDLQRALYAALWATADESQRINEMTTLSAPLDEPQETIYPFSVVESLTPDDPIHFDESRQTIQTAVDYMLAPQQTIPLWHKLLDAKMIFLIVSTGVSAMNLIHNLVMGRLLTPADYAQMTFANSLLLIFGLIPMGMQTVSARYSAIYQSQQQDDLLLALWQYGTRYGWLIGLGLAAVLLVLSPFIVTQFNLRDGWLMLPLVLAVPFFMATGTDRGLLQGKERYHWLSGAYLIEGVVRLGIGVLLTLLFAGINRGVDGAIWGLGLSLIATWAISWFAFYQSPPTTSNVKMMMPPSSEQQVWRSLFGYTCMALLGQALITNSDFLLVKSFFDGYEAGLYAAVSVTGRVVYFGTLPLMVLIVPLIAREQSLGKSTRPLFLLLMGSGVLLCSALVIASALFAPTIISTLYGADYVAGAPLLPLYAIAATLFVLTNLLVTYRVALGQGGETWMPLLAALAQIVGIVLFHDSLLTIVSVQIVMMGVLFCGVAWKASR